MEKQKPLLISVIIKLLIEKRVFVKCYNCGKSLGMFEITNENCSFCGILEKEKLIIMEATF